MATAPVTTTPARDLDELGSWLAHVVADAERELAHPAPDPADLTHPGVRYGFELGWHARGRADAEDQRRAALHAAALRGYSDAWPLLGPADA